MMNINDGGRHFISYYPDEDRDGGNISDYDCGLNRSWNQNTFTAAEIGGFYYMDEMANPILAAADGVVAFANDSEFDRWHMGMILKMQLLILLPLHIQMAIARIIGV